MKIFDKFDVNYFLDHDFLKDLITIDAFNLRQKAKKVEQYYFFMKFCFKTSFYVYKKLPS